MIFFTGLGGRDFWAPVEPRYGEIARVMFLKGEWIVPTVNGELYTDKPILYFWMVLTLSKLAGAVNEWTVRLPAALAALGLVLATYKVGSAFFNPKVGLIAGAVLATSARVIWEGRWAHLDAPFTFFFTLSMYFAARAVLDRKQRSQFLWAYACMALAVLTKGLIGVVLPALILIAFVLIRKEWGLIREARLASGIALFLLIAAPWFVWVNHATDGKWLNDFFFLHHVQRYTAGLGHREPVYYYLKTLPLDFLPWTIFCVPALFSYSTDLRSMRQPQRLFFLLWFAVVFLFFTAADTKRDLYLLPLFPPLALFVANYIEDLTSGRVAQERLFKLSVGGCFALLGAVCLAAPGIAWSTRREAVAAVWPFAGVMGVGALGVAYAVLRRSASTAVAAASVMMALGVVAATWSLLPYIDRFKSPRPVAKEIARRLTAATPLFIYADTMHDYNFYLGREVLPVVAARADLAKLRAQNPSGYMLIKGKDIGDLGTEIKDIINVDRRAGGRSWHLVPLGQIAP